MAINAGPVVGRVSVKVTPDTSGFRRATERGIGDLDDQEVGIEPKMDKFQKRFKNGTKNLKASVGLDVDGSEVSGLSAKVSKLASGIRIQLIPSLSGIDLEKAADKAAKAASGRKVYFVQEWKQRFRGGPEIGPKDNRVPTLTSDFKFFAGQLKRMSLAPFIDQIKKAKAGTSELGDGAERISGASDRAARRMQRFSSLIRASARALKSVGDAVEFGTSGYVADFKEKNWRARARNRARKDAEEDENAYWKARNAAFLEGRRRLEKLVKESQAPLAKNFERFKTPPLQNLIDVDKADFQQRMRYVEKLSKWKDRDWNLGKNTKGQGKWDIRSKKWDSDFQNKLDKLRNELKDLLSDSGGYRKAGFEDTVQKIKESAKQAADSRHDYRKFAKSLDEAIQAQKEWDSVKNPRKSLINIGPKRNFASEISEAKRQLKADTAELDRLTGQIAERQNNLKRTLRDSLVEGFDKSAERLRPLNRKIKDFGNKLNQFSVTRGGRRMTAISDGVSKFTDRFKRSKSVLKSAAVDAKDLGDAFGDVDQASTRSATSVDRGARRMQRSASKQTSAFKKFKRKFHSPAQRIFGLTRMGWIAGAIGSIVAPATALVSGLVGILPALGGAAAAALGVTVLGFEGIKDAASAASPAIDQLKSTISDTFRQRLTPQFEQLGDGLVKIEGNLNNVAHGMSDFSQGMVDAFTSNKGIKSTQEILDNTGKLFSNLKPFAENFTDGLLTMGAAGSRSFEKMASQLNNFGENFSSWADKVSEDGTLQRGLDGLLDMVGGFGNGIGTILDAGLKELPKAAEYIAPAFENIGTAVADMLPTLNHVSGNIFDAVGNIANNIKDIFANTDVDWTGMFDHAKDAVNGITDALGGLGEIVLPPVFAFMEGLLPGLADTATNLGDGIKQLAEDIRTNAPNLQDDFRQMGDSVGKIAETALQIGDSGPQTADSIKQIADAVSKLAEAMELLSRFSGVMSFLGLGSGGIAGGADNLTEKLLGLNLKDELEDAEVDVEINPEVRWPEDGEYKFEPKVDVNPKVQVNAAQADLLKQLADKLNIPEYLRLTPQVQVLPHLKLMADQGMPASVLDDALEAIAEYSNKSGGAGKQIDLPVQPGTFTFSSYKTDAVAGFKTANTEIEEVADTETKSLFERIKAKFREAQEFPDDQRVTVAASMGPSPISRMFEQWGTDLDLNAVSFGERISSVFAGLDIPGKLAAAFSGGGAGIGSPTAGFGAGVAGSMGALFQPFLTELQNLPQQAVTALASLPTVVSAPFTSLATMAGSAISGLATSVLGHFSGMATSASTSFSSMATSAGTSISNMVTTVTTGITNLVTEVTTILAGLPAKCVAALGNLGSTLYASGQALIQGFIDGIKSKASAVASAVSGVLKGARGFFPSSPAKVGPFSGRGYTTWSGKALVQDFAKGMLSVKSDVEKAAGSVVGVAQKKFANLSVNPRKSMEDYHRDAILQPVLEGNAKKIADWRKRDAELVERHNERVTKNKEESQKKIAEINNKDIKQASREEYLAKHRVSVAEREAKDTEKLAEQRAEAREKMLESLEAPEYWRINRSFQSYWIDGTKSMFTDVLKDSAKEADLSGQMRDAAMSAVATGRKTFGDHPIFNRIEFNVNAEHFEHTIQRVIEESGIAEVPVNFVVSNLEQLKSDLGMGDGVLSRALDLAIKTDPANSDWRRYQDEKPEIHYHVVDMEEAIRLEKQRERKQMLKSK